MWLKDVLKPSKAKLIIFGLFFIFEIFIQFLDNKSSNIFFVSILFFDTIISIPALAVLSISQLYFSNQLLFVIWFVVVNVVWFYLLSCIVFSVYKLFANKKNSVRGSLNLSFFRFSWVKLLLLLVCGIPLYGIVYLSVQFATLMIFNIVVDSIRNIYPNYNASESWIFYVSTLFDIVIVYFVVCGFDAIYRRYNNRIFLYILLSICLVTDIFFVVGIVLPMTKPCKVIEQSIAPACTKTEGFCMGGGCFGKSAIRDLQITPLVACLQFDINNCNGGILTVTNKCNKDLVIGDLKLPYIRIYESHPEPANLKLAKDEKGRTVVNDFRQLGVEQWSMLRNKKYNIISVAGKIGKNGFNLSIQNSRITINPQFDCLKTSVNDLNSVDDAFSIDNNCTDEVWIGDYKLQPAKVVTEVPGASYGLEFAKDSMGKVIIKQNDESNFASYTPIQDELLSMPAVIGDQKFTISYTKTKQLCE